MNNIFRLKQSFYEEIKKTPEQNFKQMNQKERNLTLIVLKSLIDEGKSSKIQEINSKELESVLKNVKKRSVNTFNNKKLKRQSNVIIRIVKSILNFLGRRISSGQMLTQFNKIASKAEEQTKRSALIREKTAHLDELKELSRFQKEDAYPLYQDILEFYLKLPDDPEAAEHFITQKIDDIRFQLEEAKQNEKERAYLYILEKEILESLTKMRQYKEKASPQHILASLTNVQNQNIKSFKSDTIKKTLNTHFKKELDLTRRAWHNAARECKIQTFTQQAIQETEKLLKQLSS